MSFVKGRELFGRFACDEWGIYFEWISGVHVQWSAIALKLPAAWHRDLTAFRLDWDSGVRPKCEIPFAAKIDSIAGDGWSTHRQAVDLEDGGIFPRHGGQSDGPCAGSD